MKQLKSISVTLVLLLVTAALVAQKNRVIYNTYVKKERVIAKNYIVKEGQNGMLNSDDYSNFNYENYKNSLNSTAHIKRLINIDWLISTSQLELLNNSRLGFIIKLNGDIIDTITIINYVNKDGMQDPYPNGDTLYRKIINDYNLTSLQRALVMTRVVKVVNINIQPLQIDVLQTIKRNSGGDYNGALLNYIKKMLIDHRETLGLTNEDCSGDTIYKTSYEPQGLGADDQIASREKFIRYVFTKI